MYEKGQNKELLDQEYLFVFIADFSFRDLGTPPPITENHSAKKNLVEFGVTPPPRLAEQSAK